MSRILTLYFLATYGEWGDKCSRRQEKNAIQIICDTISTNIVFKQNMVCERPRRNMLEWRNNMHCIYISFLFIAFCKFFHVCVCVHLFLDTKWKFVYNFSSYFISVSSHLSIYMAYIPPLCICALFFLMNLINEK